MGIGSWLKSRRYGGETGLNEMGNNAKMTSVVVAPFLAGWLFVQMVFPEEFVGWGIMGVFALWLAYCSLVYSHAKSDASGYRAFPQPVFRFPDGGMRTYNKILVPPDSWELIDETLADGRKGYHIDWGEKLQYHQKGVPFPFVFHSGFLVLPALWDESFAFASAGEFFHKNIAVEHGACESISVYVVDWTKNRDGEYEPTCLVNDCHYRYMDMMKNSKKIDIGLLKSMERMRMLWKKGRQDQQSMMEETSYLEETVEVMGKRSLKVKDLTDRSMGEIRDSVHTVMDTEEPLLKRIFNFKNLLKGVIILSIILLISHFFLGFP